MSEPLTFVDTNVLVYAHDTTNRDKQERAAAFLAAVWAEQSGVVSIQVLCEFYSVLTRKLRLEPDEARGIVAPYAAWRLVEIDMPMVAGAMLRNAQDALAWWDCLIVEAAMRAGAEWLATEDFQPGRTFDGTLEVMDPMAA